MAADPTTAPAKSRLVALQPVGQVATGLRSDTTTLVFGAALGLAGLAGAVLSLLHQNPAAPPRWVTGSVGMAFFWIGLYLASGALALRQAEAQRRRMASRHPSEPAMQDRAWDRSGSALPRWQPLLSPVLTTLFLGFFLVPFNHFAFRDPDRPWLLLAIVGIFDLALLALLVQTLRAAWQAWSFPPGRLSWPEFPCRRGRSLQLQWSPAHAGIQWSGGEAVLRCLRERMATRGTGRQRQSQLIHEVLWEQAVPIPAATRGGLDRSLGLEFHPPADLPATQLVNAPAIFWQVELRMQTAGPDPVERHLVPLY